MINVEATPIWMPRYWDKKVLVAMAKVGTEGKSYIYFCCDNNWPGLYSFSGKQVREECKVTTNGKIPVFEIPLDMLALEGELPEKFHARRDAELAKYKKTLKGRKKRK